MGGQVKRIAFQLFSVAVALWMAGGCAHQASRPRASAAPPPSSPIVDDTSSAQAAAHYESVGTDEAALFKRLEGRLRNVQRRQSDPTARVLHGKEHACRAVAFLPHKSRPAWTRQGFFAVDAPSTGVVRLSSAGGAGTDDRDKGFHGVALKFTSQPGPRLEHDATTPQAQDFLFTNKPRGTAPDIDTFVDLLEAGAEGKMAGFALRHPKTIALLAAARGVPTSLATESYWSGAAFLMGVDAVRFKLAPCEAEPPPSHHDDDADFLGAEFAARVESADVCYVLYAQRFVDDNTTPIEHGTALWDESEAPLTPLGRVVVVGGPDAAPDPPSCEGLSFSPWHAHPAHRPLGQLNRARRVLYRTSAAPRRR